MTDSSAPNPFEQLMQDGAQQAHFTVGFRGYDRDEVDAAVADLNARLQQANAAIVAAADRHRGDLERLQEEQRRTLDETLAARAEDRASVEEATAQFEADLAAARAEARESQAQVEALTAELLAAGEARDDEGDETDDEPRNRQQFEAVLRVAEEQANVLIQNAATQADRLLAAAREEIETARAGLEADGAPIRTEAQHDADQIRLRIDTEYTAHEARIEREAAHASERVAQAEREAETVRSEAEKGAAALRALVTRETSQLRADAERDTREMNARVLEFEEALTRRQDDAQQEFLVLHNQAVAHAERITADANEQVASSLEHAQRLSNRADDYERLSRAQAQQVEADAQVRARETLDRAQQRAQKIVDAVIGHTTAVLRDAEDRTRDLRWQQQQLTSFMAEVREMIRPQGVPRAGVTERDDIDETGSDAADAEPEGADS